MQTRPMPARRVKPGYYEIESKASRLFLDSLDDFQHNNWSDDALMLAEFPTRRGKWQIASVGGARGFTIKQVSSGLYCALAPAGGDQSSSHIVVLSPIPAVWDILCTNVPGSNEIQIWWATSGLSWHVVENNMGLSIQLRKSPQEDDCNRFYLTPTVTAGGGSAKPLQPGLYSVQNKSSGTFVMLAPNDKTLGCWPAKDFANQDTRVWDITPLGDGYTIRLQGTGKFWTMSNGVTNATQVNVSPVPGAWRIIPAESPLQSDGPYFRVFWGDTQILCELWGGSANPGSQVKVMKTEDSAINYQLFKFVQ